jgi:uncharacterized membrane protein
MFLLFSQQKFFLAAFGFMALCVQLTLNWPAPKMITGVHQRNYTFANTPPQDPWLSGYAISYYYFGYVMTAMLARVTDVPGMAHNLMTSLIFGLGSIGSYGILYTCFRKITNSNRRPWFAAFAICLQWTCSSCSALPFIVSIWCLLEVLHKYGISVDPETQTYSSGWTWLI